MYSSPIPNTPGIYLITCVPTQKIYVGSAINLRVRRKSHFGELQRNEHGNPKLQRAWNKYGPDAFTFEVLEFVLVLEMLTAREQFWFSKMRPFGERGFNLARVAGSGLGHPVSAEAREKMSAARRGRPNPHPGYPVSAETRARMSAAHMGNQSNLGRKHTPEHRANISASLQGNTYARGVKHSAQTRAKLSEIRKGRPVGEAQRAKLREAWADRITDTMKTFVATSPDGTEYTATGLYRFCREHNLDASALRRVAEGKQRTHKGWVMRFLDPDTL